MSCTLENNGALEVCLEDRLKQVLVPPSEVPENTVLSVRVVGVDGCESAIEDARLNWKRRQDEKAPLDGGGAELEEEKGRAMAVSMTVDFLCSRAEVVLRHLLPGGPLGGGAERNQDSGGDQDCPESQASDVESVVERGASSPPPCAMPDLGPVGDLLVVVEAPKEVCVCVCEYGAT